MKHRGPHLELHCFQGDCACGSTGLMVYLTIGDLPVTMPACPVCYKPLAGKVIGQLFGKKPKEKKKDGNNGR